MKDWLNSDEFIYLTMDCFLSDTPQDPETWRLNFYKFRFHLREHINSNFLPKNEVTYDRICGCLPGIDGELTEDDYDQLRKFVLEEE